MSAYGPNLLTDAQLRDLVAYMDTFPSRGRAPDQDGEFRRDRRPAPVG